MHPTNPPAKRRRESDDLGQSSMPPRRPPPQKVPNCLDPDWVPRWAPVGHRNLYVQPKPASQISTLSICCIGAGHVGGTVSAFLAEKNPEVMVHVVDKDQQQIDRWCSRDYSFYREPGLSSIFMIRHGRNLFFSTDVAAAISKAEIIIIAVNTPPKASHGSNAEAFDMSHFESACEDIAKYSKTKKTIVIKSTVSCGTSFNLSQQLSNDCKEAKFVTLCNPEFFVPGTALENLEAPHKIVIGYETTPDGVAAIKSLMKLYWWVPREVFYLTDLATAELAKLTTNAMLAQRVSNINSIGLICQKVGADVQTVAKVCGLDPRIGHRMMQTSLGFGGSCLEKDVAQLACLADLHQLRDVGIYWRSIKELNDNHIFHLLQLIIQQTGNGSKGVAPVAMLGCTYKANVSDVRNSPALKLVFRLMRAGYEVRVLDPNVLPAHIIDEVLKYKDSQGHGLEHPPVICQLPIPLCEGASVVVVGTDWVTMKDDPTRMWPGSPQDFKSYPIMAQIPDAVARTGLGLCNWADMAKVMIDPKLVVDNHNVVCKKTLTQLGFKVYGYKDI